MKNMKKLFLTALICAWACGVHAVDLAKATIVYDRNDAALVGHMATVLAADVELVSGVKPAVATRHS